MLIYKPYNFLVYKDITKSNARILAIRFMKNSECPWLLVDKPTVKEISDEIYATFNLAKEKIDPIAFEDQLSLEINTFTHITLELPRFFFKFTIRLSKPFEFDKYEREIILGLCKDNYGRTNTLFLPAKRLKFIDEEEYIYLKLALQNDKELKSFLDYFNEVVYKFLLQI